MSIHLQTKFHIMSLVMCERVTNIHRRSRKYDFCSCNIQIIDDYLRLKAILVISNVVEVDDGSIRCGVAEGSLGNDDITSVRTAGFLQRARFFSFDAILGLITGKVDRKINVRNKFSHPR